MMQHRITVVFTAIGLCIASAAVGKESKRFPPLPSEQETLSTQDRMQLGDGARVRIELSGQSDRIVGDIVNIDARNVSLLTDADVQIDIPRNSIAKLEIHNGKKRHVFLGLLIGVGAGAVIAAIEGPICDGGDCTTRAENISSGAIGAGVMGMIAGAFIKTDRWVQIPAEHFHVQVTRPRGGAAISFKLTF